MKPIWDSLRGRLILLVGLGLLPTLGLLLFASLQARRSVYQQVETDALSVRQLVAIGQENLVAGVQLVLTTLAQTPEVRAGGAACGVLLAAVLDRSTSYSDLLVADASGQVLCSARETGQPASVAGRPWLALALTTRQFALGDYELSPATGEPALFFASPLLDGQDEPFGVVVAEVSLARLADVVAQVRVPPTADIITFDRQGTVLTRFPVAEGMLGQRLDDSPLAQAVLTDENTAQELPGPDGDVRLYAYRPLGREAGLGLYLAVGLSRQQALAEFDRQILLYGGVIVALTFLNLGLAYLTGIQLVLRPLETLARGFRRLRQGDLAARVQMGDKRTDLGALGQDFNATAEALQARDAERQAAELTNRVLAEAGRALEASLEPTARLHGLLNAIVPAMADWCVAHLAGPEGEPVPEGVAHADLAQAAQLEAAAQRYSLEANPAAEPAQVFATGKLAFRPNLDPASNGEAPVWPLLGEMGAASLICVPLVVRGRMLGVLSLALAQASRRFVWGDATLALEVGRRAALAVDNARLFDEAQALNLQLEQRVAARTQQLRQSLAEVQASQEALRRLSRQLQSARETERRHIAREIHDELGGALTGLKMDAVALRRGLPPDETALAAKADGMTALIDTTIQTVRRLASELRPSQLDDLGLVAALEWLAGDFATRTGLAVHFEANVDYLELDPDQAIALYRTAQESLTNVARHAGASGVNVGLTLDDRTLHLVIADDGRGITADEIGQPGSLGLVSMRERIFSVAGELSIEGVPGHGTRINVRMPLSSASG